MVVLECIEGFKIFLQGHESKDGSGYNYICIVECVRGCVLVSMGVGVTE